MSFFGLMILVFWQASLIFRLSIILLTSLESLFLKMNVELHDLFFILSIPGCLWYELTVARIRSIFCKFDWECLLAGIFKLGTVFSKQSLKVELISSSFDLTFPFSIRLIFHLWLLLRKVRQYCLPKCLVIGKLFRIAKVKLWLLSGF